MGTKGFDPLGFTHYCAASRGGRFQSGGASLTCIIVRTTRRPEAAPRGSRRRRAARRQLNPPTPPCRAPSTATSNRSSTAQRHP